MANETKINWCDATWNPWHGCHKISEGCKYCYMFRDKERYGQEPNKVMRSKSTFYEPLRWKESCKVFTCSWSDFFIEDADTWRDEAWKIIKDTPHLTYQILTKRPENIESRLPQDWGYGYPNVWLGVSIENDKNKGRLVVLDRLKTKDSKFKTFISAEPLLSPIQFAESSIDLAGAFSCLDWLIIGGESGNDTGKYLYRECNLQWMTDLVIQAKDYGVSVWVKQLGTHLAKQLKLKSRTGEDISEFPSDLQIREFPR